MLLYPIVKKLNFSLLEICSKKLSTNFRQKNSEFAKKELEVKFGIVCGKEALKKYRSFLWGKYRIIIKDTKIVLVTSNATVNDNTLKSKEDYE